jgi:GDPmannose 4,6-dehydratase
VDVDNLTGDATKALNILGWQPKVSFVEMIQRMVQNDINILTM